MKKQFILAAAFALLGNSPGGNQQSTAPETHQLKALAQNIQISGSGHNLPFYNHPPDAFLNVWYNGDVVGSTQLSPVDGSYDLVVTLTGVDDLRLQEFGVRPNPFHERVNIDLGTRGGDYFVRVFDVSGREILSESYNLREGNHSFELSGLGQGVRLVNIVSSTGLSRTEKVMQTSQLYNPSVSVSESSGVFFKSVSVSDLLFEFYAPGHETFSVVESVQPNMVVDYVLQQTSQAGVRTKSTQVNDPLFNVGVPSSVVEYRVPGDNSLLVSGMTNGQGLFTGSFEHEYWVNWANSSDTVFAIPNLLVSGAHPNYVNAQVVVPNNSEMVVLDLNQVPQESSSFITTVVENDVFGFMIGGASVNYVNPVNGSTIIQGVTNSQGIHVGDVSNPFYVNPVNVNDTLFLIPNVQVNVSATNHSSASQTVPNQTSTLEFVLAQIPEQLVSNVSGVVTSSGGAPLGSVQVTALEPDNSSMNSTSTNSQGNYVFSLNYEAWNNPVNPSQSFTVPSHFLLKFEKEGYTTHTTGNKSFASSVIHDQVLSPESQSFSFTFSGLYTADDEHVNDFLGGGFVLKVKNKNTGEVQSLQQSGTNPLTVSMQGVASDEVQVWQENSLLADLVVIQHSNKAWYEDNVAQNRPTYLWAPSQSFDTLTTTLGNLANPAWSQNLEAFFFEYNHVTTNGDPKTFNGELCYMTFARPPGGGTIKKRMNSHATNPDDIALERFIWTYDFGTGTTIPQNKLDEMIDINNTILQYTTTPTGRELLPTETILVYSMSQPEVVAAQARGWTYTASTWRQAGSPNNAINFNTSTLCIDDSYSRYSQFGVNIETIMEEQFEELIGSIDPQGTSTSNYITEYTSTGVTLNKFGRHMLKINLLLDVGSQLLPANTMPPSAP